MLHPGYLGLWGVSQEFPPPGKLSLPDRLLLAIPLPSSGLWWPQTLASAVPRTPEGHTAWAQTVEASRWEEVEPWSP